MKRKLNYFSIDGAVGSNQEWFRNVVMYMGGCAAATACDSCIYLAKYKGLEQLYPGNVEEMTKEDYISFSMKMKPYLRPRIQGVKKLSMFLEGFDRYLEDCKVETIETGGFSGNHTWREAAVFIREQINQGMPVPYLMLRHWNQDYKDFIWHWFLCYGYEEGIGGDPLDGFKIQVATYGEETEFLLKDLWETGQEEKGGLIRLTDLRESDKMEGRAYSERSEKQESENTQK